MTATSPPAAGWASQPAVGRGATESEVDAATVRATALVERQRAARAEWEDVLGYPVWRDTTVLRTPDGGALEPARDREGRLLKWSFWAPHRRLLLDVFVNALPSATELEDRAVYAAAHDVRYAVVQPGERLELARVRELIEGKV